MQRISTKTNNPIPMLVVKCFVKSVVKHHKYASLNAGLCHHKILSMYMDNYTCSQELEGIHSYQALANMLEKSYPLAPFDINDSRTYPSLYKYVTDLTNILIHHILEPQRLSMHILGAIGQDAYNLACKTILKDKFAEDVEDKRDIKEIHDTEELKRKIFQEFMKASSKNGHENLDMSEFIEHLRRRQKDHIFDLGF